MTVINILLYFDFNKHNTNNSNSAEWLEFFFQKKKQPLQKRRGVLIKLLPKQWSTSTSSHQESYNRTRRKYFTAGHYCRVFSASNLTLLKTFCNFVVNRKCSL